MTQLRSFDRPDHTRLADLEAVLGMKQFAGEHAPTEPPTVREPLPEGVDQIVPANLIDPSPWNRKHFPEATIKEMASSIKEHGVLQRPTIRPKPETGRYELVFGERRWLGASRLDEAYPLPVTVRPLSDRQALEIQKIENLQREDLDPIEEAIGLRQMVREFGYTLEDLSSRLGKKKSAIYGKLKLASICEYGANLLREGLISQSVAVRICRIPEVKMQNRLCKEIRENWQVREGEQLSDREAKRMIEGGYMKELKGAPFNQADEKLVPVAYESVQKDTTREGHKVNTSERIFGGACTDCPFRAGNQPDYDPKQGRADVCLNPTCYAAKCEAQFKNRAEKHKEAGGEIAKGKIFNEWGQLKEGLTRGDQNCYAIPSMKGKKGYPTFDSLAKHLEVQPILAFHPGSGETLRLFHSGALLAKAKEKGLVKRAPSNSRFDAGQKKEAEKAKRAAAIRTAQVEALLSVIDGQVKAEREAMLLEFIKVVTAELASKHYGPALDLLAKRHGLEKEKSAPAARSSLCKHIAGLTTWQSVLGCLAALFAAEQPPSWDKSRTDFLPPLAKLFGCDIEKAAKAKAAELAAKDPKPGKKAADGKKAPKGKAPKAKGKPAKGSKDSKPSLGDRILEAIKAAGEKGITAKAIAEALSTPVRDLIVWLATSKKIPGLKKVAPMTYAWEQPDSEPKV